MAFTKDVRVRPVEKKDIETLNEFRWKYMDADLELPKGYRSKGVETVVAEKNKEIISSLTGTIALVLDPLIKNPNARALDVVGALVKQESVLSYEAQKAGAVDAYVAIPTQLSEYVDLLRGAGYEVTVENCIVMRKPLSPDTEPLIGTVREQKLLEMLQAQEKAQEEEEVGDNKGEEESHPILES